MAAWRINRLMSLIMAAGADALRTYLIILREPRCCPKCLSARHHAQRSTQDTGKRGNHAWDVKSGFLEA
jgi:hypothetical protein